MSENENSDQEKQKQKQEQESDTTGLNGVKGAMKDPLGALSRKVDEFLGREKKNGSIIKTLIKLIPFHIKVIIVMVAVIIVLVVVLILAIGDYSARNAVSTRSSAVSSLNITEESDETSQLALELYNTYDSLIGFTTDQLQTLYQTFLDDDSNNNYYLLTSGKKEFGDDSASQYSVNYKRTLYQHIQRTEKYNFNNIVWKEYTHTNEGDTMETEEKSELELIVPKDTDDETLETILKTTAPYLLTQDIPLGILCGLVGSSGGTATAESNVSEKFTYQVIKEAQSKITVNKYTLERIKYQTTQEEYYLKTYEYTYYVNEFSNGYQELLSRGEVKLVDTDDNDVKYLSEEKKIDGTEEKNYDVYWYVAEAITYDAKIVNNFNYTKYSNEDVENITNPDSNNLIDSVVIDEKYEDIQAETLETSVGVPVDSNGNYESPTKTNVAYTARYIQKEGYTYTYEKEWADELSLSSSDYDTFDYDTAKEYNTSEETTYTSFSTDKTLISEETFTQDNPSGDSIFDDYTQEDGTVKLYGMSLIDLLDSNSGIYSQYLTYNSSKVSTYEGLGRVKLKSSYNQIKNILNTLINNQTTSTSSSDEDDDEDTGYSYNSLTSGVASGTLPFAYGTSLGYEITNPNASSSSNSLSGINLLDEFIKSFEGDGSYSGGGRFDENYNKTTDDEEAVYYKVYDASDGVYTVGYGVNINEHFEMVKEALAEVGQNIDSIEDVDYGMYMNKEAIDKVHEQLVQNAVDTVESEMQGYDLTQYQIHALASRVYVHGTISKGSKYIGFTKINEFYEKYWNEETDDQYETLYEEYKDNQTAKQEIVANVDFSHGLYTNFLNIYVSETFDAKYPGYVNRKEAEWTLFTTGYYSPLQRFWTNSSSPGDVQLIGSDGNIDQAACLELQNWYEENIFGGSVSLGTVDSSYHDFDSTRTSENCYSAKTYEAASKVVGEHFEMKSSDGYKAMGENSLGIFQCTWWAVSRGTYYLTENGWTGSYINSSNASHGGDGKYVAGNIASNYNISLNTNINNIKPNSIMSITSSGSSTGHVVYVENVGNDYYVISHCGSGHKWYGVDIFAVGTTPWGWTFKGSVCLDDLL